MAAEDGVGAAFTPGAVVAPVDFDAKEIAEALNLWWKSGDGDNFYVCSEGGRWDRWNMTAVVDLMRSLPDRLVRIKVREGEQISEVKRVFMYVRQHRVLDEVFPALSGYPDGMHTLESGEKVIVRTGPKLVESMNVPWPHIRALIHNQLDLSPDGGVDQTDYFHSWCKVSAESIRAGKPGQWRAGHAMILTGPAGCGKNRLQEQVITPLLGGYGRYADPSKLLFQVDEFNSEVFKAEHWMMSEIPTPSQKTVDRTALAEKIKQTVANPSQRMRLMREDPWKVSPFIRLTISVNNNPDKLRSLPPMTGDFKDKVLIFDCKWAPLPGLVSNSIEDQRAWRELMAAELPGYLWWLLNEWQIPDKLLTYDDGRSATRFGFREFHAKCITEELHEDTPQAQLMNLIDAAELSRGSDAGPWSHDDGGGAEVEALPAKAKLWDLVGDAHPGYKGSGEKVPLWWGRAETLQLLLTGEGGYRCSVSTMAKKLFQHSKCSRLLGALYDDEMFRDVRIGRKNTNTWKGWVIAPPAES